MSPGALHLIAEQSGGEPSFSPAGGARRSFRARAAATLLLGPGSAELWALLASTWDCCSWPKPCCALPPHVSAALSSPGIPASCPGASRVRSQRREGGCSEHLRWLLEPRLRASGRQPVPPQGCLALGRKAA